MNIQEKIRKHRLWLNGESGGEKADFSGENLQGEDFSGADLRGANFQEANLQGTDFRGANLQGTDFRGANLQGAVLRGAVLRGADLRGANFQEANLQGTDFRGADLQGTDFRGANLQGANLDFSGWPIWCGSLNVKVDARIAAQLAYHFCSLGCDDAEYIAARNAILSFANKFHRVDKCGVLEVIEVKKDGKENT